MAVEKRLSDELSDAYVVKEGLEFIEKMQRLVSSYSPGTIFAEGEYPTKECISHYTLAAVVELVELMNEMPWKRWTTDVPGKGDIHTDRICEEFADVLAFLGILVGYARAFGATPEKIADAYIKVSERNIYRLTTGKR